MKKLLYILLLFPIMFACSSDDEEIPEKDFDYNKLIGVWVRNDNQIRTVKKFTDSHVLYEGAYTADGSIKYRDSYNISIKGNGVYIQNGKYLWFLIKDKSENEVYFTTDVEGEVYTPFKKIEEGE